MTTRTSRLEVLDDVHCLELIARHPIGRIGLSAGALPVVLPVNFILQGRAAIFRTEPGLKLDAARQQAVACLEVDEYDPMSHTGSSALATGRLAVVTDPVRLGELAELPLRPWGAPDAAHVVELRIELLSGRTIRLHPS